MSNIVYNAAFTPKKIAENKKKLNIPIYQRLFVWEEEQINLLLDDLKNAFNKEKEKPYYIGIITVVENNGMWDVVDGQQRLTFLSLFGACCCKNGYDYWEKFLYTETEKKESENLRIDYMGRPEDRDDLKEIASGDFANVYNPNFKKFVECIKKKFQISIPEDFATYVYTKASFLVSELPANYAPADLNLFFEKMNATGKQLTAVEQIKGKYFPASAACFDACLNFEEKFKWQERNGNESNNKKKILDILTDTNVTINTESASKTSDATRRSILSPEVFLLHCLEILEQKNVSRNEREILETFKAHVASEGEGKITPDNFLKKMQEYRTWLDNNIIYLKAAPDGSWEYTLRKEDDEKYKSNLEDKKMKQFQSMLYVSSSNYQEWVLKAYPKAEKISLKLLKDQDADAERHTPVPNAMNYQSIDRYWFWKLDYLLWESFIDNEESFGFNPKDKDDNTAISAIRNYKFRRNRSIEHLHPQTDDGSWEDAKKHQFGNLAMISSSFNSAQQNDSVGIKFQRLKEVQLRNNNLESIKLLLMFKLARGQESGWTIEAMENHESEMFELLGIQKNNC